MYLLGFDIGSSSIKGALVDVQKRTAVDITQYPKTEMSMDAPHPGWAEQDPDVWWDNVCRTSRELLEITEVSPEQISGIGISYQMHGLVAIDKLGKPVRKSIIWCDSRAVEIGDKAFESLGREYCINNLLNSPGNFTASKLNWMWKHEPSKFQNVDKFMLPGDYIAFRMTGSVTTTISGLSEGILWDFVAQEVAGPLLDHYRIERKQVAEIRETFGIQGHLTESAALQLGLKKGIPVSYRAGDQPNNALSLGVFHPGEFAGTGGTSGVIYGVADKNIADTEMRVNSFAHVNYTAENPRIGVLLCINGAGSMYNWTRQYLTDGTLDYNQMEKEASGIAVGSEEVCILPFGNGAERMLGNRSTGAVISGLQLNSHRRAHLIRASLEGIAFAFVYGAQAMKSLGMKLDQIRVGNDNLFQSEIFSQTISNLLEVEISVVKTTGAVGAALGAGYGAGIYSTLDDAVSELEIVHTFVPERSSDAYKNAYLRWEKLLRQQMENI